MAYPDDDPLAQQVLDALMARLATIQPPTYHTAVASVVLMEPGRDVTVHGSPVLAVLPGTEAKSDDTINCVVTRQRVLIGATIRDGGQAADGWRREMRLLLADIEQAIHGDPQFGGLVRDTHVLDPTILPHTGTTLVQGEVELELVYAHHYLDVSVPV